MPTPNAKLPLLRSLLIAVAVAVALVHATPSVSYAFEIPKLNRQDLVPAIQILGFGTADRYLSNPFPLGGYTGIEIGYSYEVIDVQDLAFLGTGTVDQKDDLAFSRLTLAKGLFNDIDASIHFTPFSQSVRISEYGAGMKWNFYQAKFVPFSISALVNYSSVTIEDVYANESLGLDLMGGINVDSFALYFGGGQIDARSNFAPAILNYSATSAKESARSTHSFVGIHFEISSFFVAAQIDRYVDPVYSIKLGYRR